MVRGDSNIGVSFTRGEGSSHVAASMHYRAHDTFTLENGGAGGWNPDHWLEAVRKKGITLSDSPAKSSLQPWWWAGAGRGRRMSRESDGTAPATQWPQAWRLFYRTESQEPWVPALDLSHTIRLSGSSLHVSCAGVCLRLKLYHNTRYDYEYKLN